MTDATHTYTVMRFRIEPGRPLTLGEGERIVDVLRSDVAYGGVGNSDMVDVVVLIEVQRGPDGT